MDDLQKDLKLQSQEVSEGVEQFKVTLPSNWIKGLGWPKGKALIATLDATHKTITLKGDENA